MEYRSRENSAVFIKPDIKRDLQKCKIMSLFSIIFFVVWDVCEMRSKDTFCFGLNIRFFKEEMKVVS